MEQTTCYKCDTEIQAPEGAVHPLCFDCDNEFESWLADALGGQA